MIQASVTIDPVAGIYTAIVALPLTGADREARQAVPILWLEWRSTLGLLADIAERSGWLCRGYFDTEHRGLVVELSDLRGTEE